ncbi:3-oxo-5-alpha-steroid 4-dehydrogenase [Diplodia corticola]|uniref:3-oxo-5-alpha-steroid 4-dehydrogenase n=1 Tax=Diplodia corticola TaxID=236234 RepID=A0A1J9RLG5_9PEZI|nr:3-oxo-5-alpha-steroid 4-dehydrogenase [Diplodia corticola]OJD28764.1 3-oxo-5-alpha-steroid 4-dehydrogenase [Diplodia corticola]
MSPIHPFVCACAAVWQLCNATALGGWLAGHGPRSPLDWAGRLYVAELGMVVWGWGLLANMYHDDDLREIRRAAARRQRREREAEGKEGGAATTTTMEKEGVKGKGTGGVDKVYMLPKNGLFRWVLYAHYLCEWVEWCGFWMVGGWGCTPARSFVLNEIATMLPRAVQGKRWYIERFGADKVGNRKAAIPGIL